MARDIVLSIENFSVQFGSIFILERKETTNHGKKNHSCAPDVDHQRLVGMFSLDHLGSGITRRSTGGSQPFLRFIGVGKTKVNNSDGFVIVNQAVFKFKISMNDS